MTHGELCLSFAVPALGSSTHYAWQLRSAGQKCFKRRGQNICPQATTFLLKSSSGSTSKSLVHGFQEGTQQDLRHFLQLQQHLSAATAPSLIHSPASAPLKGETLTRERSCTCSRASQHTQRLSCHALSVAVLCARPLHTLRKAFTVRKKISRSYMMFAGKRLKQ